jgi:RNA polymerase sigma factor (sigma-70 family)
MNYRELKALVASTQGKKVPGYKELMKSGSRVVIQNEDIVVYENGFYIYADEDGHVTVYAVDRCSDLTYEIHPSTDEVKEGTQLPNCTTHYYAKAAVAILNEKYFGDVDWNIPLTVAAGHRLNHNDERGYEKKKAYSIGSEQSEGEEEYLKALADRQLDEEQKSKEYKRLYAAMEHLTDKQKEVIYLFYFKGMKQPQIAEKLGISLDTVKDHKKAALNKIKKFF